MEQEEKKFVKGMLSLDEAINCFLKELGPGLENDPRIVTRKFVGRFSRRIQRSELPGKRIFKKREPETGSESESEWESS